MNFITAESGAKETQEGGLMPRFYKISNICSNVEMQGKVSLDFAVVTAFCKALSM